MKKLWRELVKSVKSIAERTVILLRVSGHSFVDCSFLCIWGFVNYKSDGFLKPIALHGVENAVLWGLRGLFAVFTLVPLVMYFLVDLTKLWSELQGHRRCSHENCPKRK